MRLRTLGGLEVEGSDFSSPQPLLLTYLALEGSKDRCFLAELFWLGTKDPLARLSVALTRLRKGAPGAIEADNRRAWATVETDAQQLLTALENRELAAGLELFRGPFLEGVYLRDWGAELEEWIYATREFVAGRVSEALVSLAEAEAAEGEFEAATQRAERAFDLGGSAAEPELLGRLHALLLAGKSPRAVAVGQEASSFGVEITASMEEAKARLHPDIADPGRRVPNNLSAGVTTFVGRDLELTEILNLLADSDHRLITLLGPGGVGKTRLALQVAEEQLRHEQFGDGVYHLELDALSSAEFIPTSLAEALGVTLQGTAPVLERVAVAIGERRILLLLDNYEHLMEGALVPAELLELCPNLKVLVTSRERLNLEEEWAFPVEGLAFPTESKIDLERALYFDAPRLFVQRAKRVRGDYDLTPENLPHVLEICRLVEGSPLGLELAATWTRAMSVAEVVQEMGRSLDFLTTQTRNVASRHRSIRAAFESSWQLLEPGEQEVLARVSVFRGGFRREAAAEVAGATIPLLVSLIDKSLLRVTPAGRYDRHPLLYGYMREKLAQHSEEEARIRERHATHFARLLYDQAGEHSGPRQREALAILEEELDNIRVAWDWAVTEEREDVIARSLAALEQFYDVRSRFQEARDLFEPAAAAFEGSLETPARTLLHSRLRAAQGWFLHRLSAYRRAEQLLRESVETFRRLGAQPELAEALHNLARVALHMGEYPKAEELLEECLALQSGLADSRAVAKALTSLGMIAYEKGEFQEAEKRFREGIALQREMGDRRAVARSLLNLANTGHRLGNYPESFAYLQEGLGHSRDLADRMLEASYLNGLGNVVQRQGKVDESRRYYLESLTIKREIGDLRGTATVLDNLGISAHLQGDFEETQRFRQESLSIRERIGDRWGVANSQIGLGSAAYRLGEVEVSKRNLLQGLNIAFDIESWILVLDGLVEAARLLNDEGRSDLAAAALYTALHHPASDRTTRNEAQHILTELEAALPLAEQGENHVRALRDIVAEITSHFGAAQG